MSTRAARLLGAIEQGTGAVEEPEADQAPRARATLDTPAPPERVAAGSLSGTGTFSLEDLPLAAPPEREDDTTPEPTRPEELPDRVRRWNRRYRMVVLAVALALVPIASSLVTGITSHWVPVGDDAIIAIRTRDVLTGHPPTLGQATAYAQLSGRADAAMQFHPGPLHYYLLAPFYALSGWSPVGLLIGVAVLNAAAVLAIAWACVRRREPVLACWAMLVVTALEWSLGRHLLYRPLSTTLAALPLLAFLFLTAGVLSGDIVLLPAAAFAGSLAIQPYLGYARVAGFVVASAGVIAAIWLARFIRARYRAGLDGIRPPQLPKWHWPVGLTVVVLAVCWLPVLIQQAVGNPGNITESLRGYTNKGAPAGLGVGFAVKSMAVVAELPPMLHRVTVFASTPVNDLPAKVSVLTLLGFALPLVALVVLLVIAVRRRRWQHIGLLATAVAAYLGATLALTLATNPSTLTLSWAWPVAAYAWAVIGWVAYALVNPFRGARRPLRRRLGQVLVGATALMALVTLLAPTGEVPLTTAHDTRVSRATNARVVRALPGKGPYTLVTIGRTADTSLAPALAAELVKQPVTLRIQGIADSPEVLGTFRDPNKYPHAPRLIVTTVNPDTPPVHGARLLARSPAPSPAQELQFVTLRNQLLARLQASPPRVNPHFRGEFRSLIREAMRREAAAQLTADRRHAPRLRLDNASVDRAAQRYLAHPELLLDAGILPTMVKGGYLLSPHLPNAPVEQFARLWVDVATGQQMAVWLAPPA